MRVLSGLGDEPIILQWVGHLTITNSDLNSPCSAWHPYGKLGLFKTELVITRARDSGWTKCDILSRNSQDALLLDEKWPALIWLFNTVARRYGILQEFWHV